MLNHTTYFVLVRVDNQMKDKRAVEPTHVCLIVQHLMFYTIGTTYKKIYTLGLIISLNFRYKVWGSLMQNAFRRQIHRGKSRLVQITWHSAKKKTKNNCIVYGFSLGG